jgi:hypothetical protein
METGDFNVDRREHSIPFRGLTAATVHGISGRKPHAEHHAVICRLNGNVKVVS